MVTSATDDVLTKILQALTFASIPHSSFDHNFTYLGYPSIHNLSKKLGIITVLDLRLTKRITSTMHKTLIYSCPQCHNTLPSIPTREDIDLTRHIGDTFPRYCSIQICPFHNNCIPIFPNTTAGASSHKITAP